MKDNKILGVYLDLSTESAQKLRKKVRVASSKTTISYNSQLPYESLKYHITLFMSPFPLTQYNQVLKVVEEITHDLMKINLYGERLSTSRNKFFLFLDIAKNASITRLHERLVISLKDYREGLVYPDFENADWIPKKNLDYLYRYGFPWVLDEYEPHISLFVSKIELKLEDFEPYFELPVDILIEKLCVGEIGQFGTIKKELFSLRIA